jgi:hypothetical protein
MAKKNKGKRTRGFTGRVESNAAGHGATHRTLMSQLNKFRSPLRPPLKLESKMPLVMKRLSQSK